MKVTNDIVETLETTNWSNIETRLDKANNGMNLKADVYISDKQELQEIINYLTGKLDDLKEKEAE